MFQDENRLAFLAMIRESPDDLGVRMRYADWLEDERNFDTPEKQKSARDLGEFIRIGCALFEISDENPPDERMEKLMVEAHNLVGRHLQDWEAEIRSPLNWHKHVYITYDRGLPHKLMLKDHSDSLIPALLDSNLLNLATNTLMALEAAGTIKNADMVRLAGYSGLSHLTSLEFVLNSIEVAGIQALAASPYLSRLTSLIISWNNIGDTGARALAESPYLSCLTSLNLERNGIGVIGTQALAGPESRLKKLSNLSLARNNIGNAGAQALANSPILSGLTSLNLRECGINGAGIQALAGEQSRLRLSSLDLDNNHFRVADIEAMMQCPRLSGLSRLDLRENRIGITAARTLAACQYLSGLSCLDLGNNRIDVAGVVALFRSQSTLKNLSNLILDHNNIGNAGAKALANSPILSGLTNLDIRGNAIGAAGERALAASTVFKPSMLITTDDFKGSFERFRFREECRQKQNPKPGRKEKGREQ